jgi:large subunit ribosomal protein L17
MPAPTKGPRLGSGPAHERLMLANLATALFEYGSITTTEAKAKRLRPLAERLITFAKRGDLHARRQVLTVVRDNEVVHELFADIGPRFADRQGGYTRIIKLSDYRIGDGGSLVLLQLLTEESKPTGTARRSAGLRRKRNERRHQFAGRAMKARSTKEQPATEAPAGENPPA